MDMLVKRKGIDDVVYMVGRWNLGALNQNVNHKKTGIPEQKHVQIKNWRSSNVWAKMLGRTSKTQSMYVSNLSVAGFSRDSHVIRNRTYICYEDSRLSFITSLLTVLVGSVHLLAVPQLQSVSF